MLSHRNGILPAALASSQTETHDVLKENEMQSRRVLLLRLLLGVTNRITSATAAAATTTTDITTITTIMTTTATSSQPIQPLATLTATRFLVQSTQRLRKSPTNRPPSVARCETFLVFLFWFFPPFSPILQSMPVFLRCTAVCVSFKLGLASSARPQCLRLAVRACNVGVCHLNVVSERVRHLSSCIVDSPP